MSIIGSSLITTNTDYEGGMAQPTHQELSAFTVLLCVDKYIGHFSLEIITIKFLLHHKLQTFQLL